MNSTWYSGSTPFCFVRIFVSTARARINHQIRAPELRVIGPAGENLGVLPLGEALRRAAESGADLIEVSPTATPPVAKIMEYGKYAYEENKRKKAAQARGRLSELKIVQIKIGTSEHDLALKAHKAGAWLGEGHRVRVELFLAGRAKFMEEKFLRERLERILRVIPAAYNIAVPVQRGPKGLALIIEKA